MKVYFAGPLFSTPERSWNAEVASGLRTAGHEVFLPQENEPGLDAAGIFAADKAGIDGSECLVAIMDGPGPDAGTSWEVGYAFGRGMPIVLVRTDFRVLAGDAGDYSPMLTQAATIRLDLPATATETVVNAVIDALAQLERA
jgi:nucleoside 2-deoxyribosyltransferase